MSITAKVLIPHREWIINNGREKIATLRKNASGYTVLSRGKAYQIHELNEIVDKFGFIIPDEPEHSSGDSDTSAHEVHGFPTKGIMPSNPLWDVARKLPIFTKTNRSKCFFCAGYYAIKFSNLWIKCNCPKFLTITRYPYAGPYKTEEEATAAVNSLNRESHNERA
jgi:hypothetical protein